MIKKLINYKYKFNSILNSKSHALIIECSDEKYLNDFAIIFVLNLLCKNKICLNCSNCKKILNGNCLDVLYFKNTLLVEDVEKIIEDINIIPAENDYKIYLINNFDECSERVQNKLLKTLEEPPRFVKFLLLTKNLNSLLKTVVSRCEKYSLPKFSKEELLYILEGEEAYSLPIVENCDGLYGTAVEYSNNENFIKTYDLAFDILKNMTISSQILQYSNKILGIKENILLLIKILQNILLDIIKFNCNCEDLVKNKSKINDIKILVDSFNNEMCVKIISNLDLIKEKLKFNSNFNLVVDTMLLNILEVKFKCKR